VSMMRSVAKYSTKNMVLNRSACAKIEVSRGTKQSLPDRMIRNQPARKACGA
jgi:hypothetical protein